MPDLFIGLMSGTSVDAVDGALVDFSGVSPETLAFASLPMPAALRGELLSLQQPGADELARAARATVDPPAISMQKSCTACSRMRGSTPLRSARSAPTARRCAIVRRRGTRCN